jgi:hypothetical protein
MRNENNYIPVRTEMLTPKISPETEVLALQECYAKAGGLGKPDYKLF